MHKRRAAALLGFVVFLGWASGCAHKSRELNVALTPERQQQARARIDSLPSPPPLWAAQGLLVAYGHNERVRTRVQLLVGAPDKFRFTALGPHNAALAVVASDGTTLSTVDVRSGQTTRVPATREGLSRLMQGLDIGLPLPMWLSLLTFRFALPEGATAYERAHDHVAWAWTTREAISPTTVLADATGRIVGAHVPQPEGGAVDASFLPSSRADAPLVAKEIDVRVTRTDGQLDSSLSLSLEHFDLAPDLLAGASPFVVGTAP